MRIKISLIIVLLTFYYIQNVCATEYYNYGDVYKSEIKKNECFKIVSSCNEFGYGNANNFNGRQKVIIFGVSTLYGAVIGSIVGLVVASASIPDDADCEHDGCTEAGIGLIAGAFYGSIVGAVVGTGIIIMNTKDKKLSFISAF